MSRFSFFDINPDRAPKGHFLSKREELVNMLDRVGVPGVTRQGTPFLSYPFGEGPSGTIPLRHPSIRSAAINEFTERHGHPPSDGDLRSAFRVFTANGRARRRSRMQLFPLMLYL